jgi:hypothetical protein
VIPAAKSIPAKIIARKTGQRSVSFWSSPDSKAEIRAPEAASMTPASTQRST